MNAAETLARLTALSSEIKRAAIVDRDGAVLAATSAADGESLARAAAALLDIAPAAAADVAHVAVGVADGSVVAVRASGRVAVAITTAEPATALVLHDLRTALEQASDA